MKNKSIILSADKLNRALTRISHEILEHNLGADDVVIIGIQSRGAIIAKRLIKKINKIEGKELNYGALDIALYRDDITKHPQPVVKKTEIDFDISNKNVVLVDDVLFTGRTIRAAMDALNDFGRPKTIQLAVLIDRGHRELPIRPDYIGKNIPTSQNERVGVLLEEEGGNDSVIIEIEDDN